jgi:hypothetical protein
MLPPQRRQKALVGDAMGGGWLSLAGGTWAEVDAAATCWRFGELVCQPSRTDVIRARTPLLASKLRAASIEADTICTNNKYELITNCFPEGGRAGLEATWQGRPTPGVAPWDLAEQRLHLARASSGY